MNDNIKLNVERYYNEKLRLFGKTSKGVDWNTSESQDLRFDKLCELIKSESNFSLIDYGCGFGSLLEFLASNDIDLKYCGYDISEEMILNAKAFVHEMEFKPKQYSFVNKLDATSKYDYLVASGLFNVKLESSVESWEKYIYSELKTFNEITTKGFAFNALTSYSDAEFMKDTLYYCDPLVLFDFCKKNFSKKISLLHDYELYEFTIIVKK